MEKNFKLTKLEKSWILYDVGNSAFTLLISTIFPIYFDVLASSAGITSEQYLTYWGYAISFVTIIVACSGPILGALSDRGPFKKRFLLSAVVIGCISTIALAITSSWVVFLLVFMVAKVAYSLSLIFYDSMLVDVTDEYRMDKVSSFGYAFGYIGSVLPFAVSIIFVLFYESMGLSFQMAIFIAFCINALWWFVMTLPIVKQYKQKYVVQENHASFIKVWQTLKEISENKKVFFFLIAFFFYIDGVYTIIDMATAYGTALGLDSTGLLLALLVTQLVAFPFAILFGRLSQKYDSEKLISICILSYTGIGFYAIFLNSQFQFWTLAILVGMFQGGIQALSRSHFGKIIPEEKSGEYFGILDICGKGASFIGTMLVSFGTQISGNMSVGVSVITPLIFMGFLFFRKSTKVI